MNSMQVSAPNGVVDFINTESYLIKQYGIGCLYHITHIDNLSGILEHGLLSHNLAHQQCLVTDISDINVNARRAGIRPMGNLSLHDYVPTYFNSRNAMSYVRREQASELVVLKLNPQLLLQTKVLFTDGNAASCNTSFFNDLNDLSQLNWECLNDRTWFNHVDGKRQRCAEMLIPNCIPLENIMQIAVKSSITLKKALDLVTTDIQLIKQPELFF